MKAILSLIIGLVSANAYGACPANTTQHDVALGEKATTCVLTGTIVEDTILSNDNDYYLVGGVFIGFDNGEVGADQVLDTANLTIQPGTTIYALNPSKNPVAEGIDRKDFLVISRGSKIFAEGTVDQPIVFTSHSAAPARGDWGGLFINGYAPTNKCADLNNCAAKGEAGTGFYGGNNPADDSGVLRYVRLEYSGDKISTEKEFNGITFNGTGAGTLVEFVQVYETGDDGIEFFGGNVNVRYAVVSHAGDDSIDWTGGYQGFMQYVLVVQADDEADRGIEADNNSDNPDAEPRSNPTLSNITIMGSQAGSQGTYFRVGSSVTMTNSVVTGFSSKCVRLGDAVGVLQISNNYYACNDLGSAVDFVDNKMVSNADLLLEDYMPAAGSPLLGAGFIGDLDFFFDDVDFIGAFDGQTDWTEGNWTVGL